MPAEVDLEYQDDGQVEDYLVSELNCYPLNFYQTKKIILNHLEKLIEDLDSCTFSRGLFLSKRLKHRFHGH